MMTSLRIITVILLTEEVLSACPATGVITLDGYRYTRVLSKLQFRQANYDCNRNYDGGYLAHIHNGNVSQAVYNIISGCNETFRIGLQYETGLINGAGWYWTDANPYDDIDPQPLLDEQSKWDAGEGGGMDGMGACVIPVNHTWIEIPHTEFHSFICEKNLLTIDSTTTEEYVKVGDNVDLLVAVASFEGPVTINLFKNRIYENMLDSTSMGNGSWRYEIVAVTENDTGLYEFFATTNNNNDYERSASTFVSVQDPATIVSELPIEASSPVTRGPSTIECRATGIPTPTVYWTKSSVSVRNDSTGPGVYQIIGKNAASLHIESSVCTDDGVYVCVAENRLGKVGYEVTVTKSTTLRVFGRPTILRALVINWTEDSLEVGLSWKPDNQTLGIIHTILGNSSSDSREFNVVPQNTSEILTDIKLSPIEGVIDISATVCPNDCIANLGDKATFFNTVPNPVVNASVTKVNGSTLRSLCQVRWKWREQTYAQDTITFKVHKSSFPVNVRDAATFTPSNRVVDLPAQSYNNYTTEIGPNSQYSFDIIASNFAGDSTRMRARGDCIGGMAAPYNIPKPYAKFGNESATTFGIVVDVPDESNGLISCLFFIVRLDGGVVGAVTIEKLQTLSKNSASDPSSQDVDEYVAASLPMYDAVQKDNITVVLGDNKLSICDSYAISNPRSNSQSGRQAIAVYAGFNWPLKINRTYSVSVVSTTPVDAHSIVTAQSESFTFVHRYDSVVETSADPSNQSLWWVAMAVVGGVMMLVILGLICRCADHKFRGSKQTQPQRPHPIECHADVPHRNDISKGQKEPEYETMKSASVYDNVIRDEKSRNRTDLQWPR